MRFMMCVKRKHKVNIFNIGDTLDSLIMVSSICKTVSEQIASEKGMNEDEALKFVVDSIYESYELLKN